MASTVLSGPSNPTYTNNTGQNVRIVINYMSAQSTTVQFPNPPGGGETFLQIVLRWAGVSVSSRITVIGRNLAIYEGIATSGGIALVASNAFGNQGQTTAPLPTEIMLAPGQTFSATCNIYNIVVIPENG